MTIDYIFSIFLLFDTIKLAYNGRGAVNNDNCTFFPLLCTYGKNTFVKKTFFNQVIEGEKRDKIIHILR